MSSLFLTIVVLACSAIITSALYEKDYPNAGLYLQSYNCILDPSITEENFMDYQSEVASIWSSACGANRGIFVLDPADGQTYNCGKLPVAWGVETVDDIFTVPPAIGRNALDLFLQAVYNTSSYEEAECAMSSLTEFRCGREHPWRTAPWYDKLKAPIRGANVGGLFVLERWMLPNFTVWGTETGIIDQYTFSEKCEGLGICNLLIDHWETFYSQTDFNEMKALGLNTVRFPVGHWYFEELSGFPAHPYIIPAQSILDKDHPITKILFYAKNAGIHVIIDLHTAPGSQNGFDNSGQTTNMTVPDNWGQPWIYNPTNVNGTVATCAAIAKYINYVEANFGIDNIIALEILNEPWEDISMGLLTAFYKGAIAAVREVSPQLPLFLHDSFRGDNWGLELKNWPYENVFFDTHSYECFQASDLASDTPSGDRQKMYVHELEACAMKIPLHYETCNALPVMVGEFSLAIDDCMPHLNAQHENYGQCDNILDRLNSSWWDAHVTSYAMRQIATWERELGWCMWAWKLSPAAEAVVPSAWYWSFRSAAAKGYINTSAFGENSACQFVPDADYSQVDDHMADDDDLTMEKKDFSLWNSTQYTKMKKTYRSKKSEYAISQDSGSFFYAVLLVSVISFSLGCAMTYYFLNRPHSSSEYAPINLKERGVYSSSL